jgi:molecular chaperone DnaK (HSP70)
MKLCLGIDFGTTNSCLSVWHQNKSIIIQDIDGSSTIPTVIEISDNNKIIGKSAYVRKDVLINPLFTVYEIKRLIGKKYTELDVDFLNTLAYQVLPDENDCIMIRDNVENRLYHVEEILMHLFMSFKHRATTFLQEKKELITCNNPLEDFTIDDAIISVPVNFNKIQRETIKECATNAGFNVLRLINEPTAAALSYGLGTVIEKEDGLNIVVVDFGGGTFDVSMLNIQDGLYEVLATSGNEELGGSDFDQEIINYAITEFAKINKLDKRTIFENIATNSLQKLKYSAEQAKITLSEHLNTRIVVPRFYNGINLTVNLERKQLMEICNKLIYAVVTPLQIILELCGLKKDEVDEIIMVGGMTRMPIIRHTVESFFGKDVNCSIDPDKVVSIGASIHGYMITNKDNITNKLLLVDRTALSIGLEMGDGTMDVIVPRGTIIPAKKYRKYSTTKDYMETITFKIYEGERRFAGDCKLIGDFVLSGIEKEKRGIPRIQVCFEIDMDGIIRVKAEDLNNTLNKKTIQITNEQSKLSPETIQQIIENAKIMDNNDKVECIKKQSHVTLLDYCSRILENLASPDNTVADAERKQIEQYINETVTWLNETHYTNIEVEKYVELKKFFTSNYSILIIPASKDTLKVLSADETSKEDANKTDVGVAIIDESNEEKYAEQIAYFKTVIAEYGEFNKQIKFYEELEDVVPEILNTLNTIKPLLHNIIEFANEKLLLFFIMQTIDETELIQNMNKLYRDDVDFKYEFEKIYDVVNVIGTLRTSLEQKESEIMDMSDEDVDETKMEKLLAINSQIYNIENGYVKVGIADVSKLLEEIANI